MFAIGWAGGNRIMPEHIWKPICTAGDPTTFCPDPNMIENGPWRLASYKSSSSVVLIANTPGSVVTANIEGVSGSVPITSTQGYFRYLPIDVHTDVTDPTYLAYLNHLPDDSNGTEVTFTTTYENLFADRDISVHSTVYANSSLVIDLDWILEHDSSYAVPVVAKGFDMQSIYKWVGDGLSWWVWNGTHLQYYKIIEFESTTNFQLTWNHTKIGSPLIFNNTWDVIIHDEFAFPGMFMIMPNLPLNTPFHYDIEWYMFSMIQDIGGTTWYDSVTKIIDPETGQPIAHWIPANPYKSELAAPDGKVDGKDIAIAAKAFGTVPGDPRWSTIADVNHDYKVDGKDLAQIAKQFGYYAH
jgi:hypothetical protein